MTRTLLMPAELIFRSWRYSIAAALWSLLEQLDDALDVHS